MFVYRGHDVATVVASHLVCSVRSCSCLLTLSHVNHVCEQDKVLNVNYLVATLKQTMRRGRPSSKRTRDAQTPHTGSQPVDQLSGLPVEALTGKGASRRKRSKKFNKSKRSTVTVSGRQNIGKFLLKFFRKSVTYNTPEGWYKGTVLNVKRNKGGELRYQTAYYTGRGQYLEDVSEEVLEQALQYWEAACHEWKGDLHTL